MVLTQTYVGMAVFLSRNGDLTCLRSVVEAGRRRVVVLGIPKRATRALRGARRKGERRGGRWTGFKAGGPRGQSVMFSKKSWQCSVVVWWHSFFSSADMRTQLFGVDVSQDGVALSHGLRLG